MLAVRGGRLSCISPVRLLATFWVSKTSERNFSKLLFDVLAVQSLSHVWCFCDPIDCSPPGSPVHKILQARMLEWVSISSSRGSSRPRGQIHVSCISCIAGFSMLSHRGSPHVNRGVLNKNESAYVFLPQPTEKFVILGCFFFFFPSKEVSKPFLVFWR